MPGGASRSGVAEARAGRELRQLQSRLLARYDGRDWWPARSRLEVMAGAILVQRSTWPLAAAAVARLRHARLLQVERLRRVTGARLVRLLQPCGPPQRKARSLQALASFVGEQGGLARLAGQPTDELRQALLGVHGIGPETADVILLYAFRRPLFVADGYALRLLQRSGWLSRAALRPRYAEVREAATRMLDQDAEACAALHAAIVEHGKETCRPRPRCVRCFLARHCATGREATGSRRPGR